MFNAEKIKDEIVLWIREHFLENGPNSKAVIGISGGKDSSVVAALCVEALGKDRVYGVLMPQGKQHDIDVSLSLVEFLNIPYITINIGEVVDSEYKALNQGGLLPNDIAIINTPARIRMTTLYAVSAIVNGRVANTSNFSEDYVGYATKFGDTAGDFAPIANLTVTEVKAVGRTLSLPEKFIEKIPEDGLTGKTDEEKLGFTYKVLDSYIRSGICENKNTKEKIDRLHKNNLHKLKPLPAYKKFCETSEKL